jgi:hypothetical protein
MHGFGPDGSMPPSHDVGPGGNRPFIDQGGVMPVEETSAEILGADAAHAAASATVRAIDDAVKRNDDPTVAEALLEAAVLADQASSRTEWLRRMVNRRSARLHV